MQVTRTERAQVPQGKANARLDVLLNADKTSGSKSIDRSQNHRSAHVSIGTISMNDTTIISYTTNLSFHSAIILIS